MKDLGLLISGWDPVARSWEHGNEPSGSITGEEFPYYLSYYWLIEYTAPFSNLLVTKTGLIFHGFLSVTPL
jgi:hypothetical protein